MLEGGLRGAVWSSLEAESNEKIMNPTLQALQYVIQNKNNYKLWNKRKFNTGLIFAMMSMSLHFEISDIRFFI